MRHPADDFHLRLSILLVCGLPLLVLGILLTVFLIVRIYLEMKWRHLYTWQEMAEFIAAGAPLTRPIFRLKNHRVPRVIPNDPVTAKGFENPVYEMNNANDNATNV